MFGFFFFFQTRMTLRRSGMLHKPRAQVFEKCVEEAKGSRVKGSLSYIVISRPAWTLGDFIVHKQPDT